MSCSNTPDRHHPDVSAPSQTTSASRRPRSRCSADRCSSWSSGRNDARLRSATSDALVFDCNGRLGLEALEAALLACWLVSDVRGVELTSTAGACPPNFANDLGARLSKIKGPRSKKRKRKTNACCQIEASSKLLNHQHNRTCAYADPTDPKR